MEGDGFTNKELAQMLMQVRTDLASTSTTLTSELTATRNELAATRESMKRYNGLWEKQADLEHRVQAIEEQGKGRAGVAKGLREWGGWALALIGFALTWLRVNTP